MSMCSCKRSQFDIARAYVHFPSRGMEDGGWPRLRVRVRGVIALGSRPQDPASEPSSPLAFTIQLRVDPFAGVGGGPLALEGAGVDNAAR